MKRLLHYLAYKALRLSAMTIVASVFSPLIPLFFPRAEKVAAKYGMTEAQVKNLTGGKRVYVMEGPVADVLESISFTDSRQLVIPSLLVALLYASDKPYGVAFDDDLYCRVYLRNPGKFSPDKKMQKEFARFVFKHELAHCNDADEAEADYAALTEAPAASKKMKQLALDRRAAHRPNPEDEHDMILTLDAFFKNQEGPDEDELDSADYEAEQFLKVRKEDKKAARELLRPLAKKRIEFYEESRKRLKIKTPSS